MKNLLTVILAAILGYIKSAFEEIAEAIEARDKARAIKNIVTLLAIGLGVVGFLALILALLYAGREAIFAVVGPVAIAAVLIKSYQLNHPRTGIIPDSVPQPGTIELATARAKKVYSSLTQTAFLLLSELCRYLPGLVKPFSLGAVVPSVHFDITASLLTIYHFIIAKGEDESAIPTITEILETLIDQHTVSYHTRYHQVESCAFSWYHTIILLEVVQHEHDERSQEFRGADTCSRPHPFLLW